MNADNADPFDTDPYAIADNLLRISMQVDLLKKSDQAYLIATSQWIRSGATYRRNLAMEIRSAFDTLLPSTNAKATNQG